MSLSTPLTYPGVVISNTFSFSRALFLYRWYPITITMITMKPIGIDIATRIIHFFLLIGLLVMTLVVVVFTLLFGVGVQGDFVLEAMTKKQNAISDIYTQKWVNVKKRVFMSRVILCHPKLTPPPPMETSTIFKQRKIIFHFQNFLDVSMKKEKQQPL